MSEVDRISADKSTDKKAKMPDVALEKSLAFGLLQQVGMSKIEVPILIDSASTDRIHTPALVEAFVSLDDAQARGIHMSRLFRIVQAQLPSAPMSFPLLAQTCEEFLQTHAGLSHSACIAVDFTALVQRKALKSENLGWRSYPVRLEAKKTVGKEAQFFAEVMITYSSTCPASTALARQLVAEQFRSEFSNSDLQVSDVYNWLSSPEGMRATPHAQRSQAKVRVEVQKDYEYLKLIDLLEESLQTAVQAVVKREDEQEFALRNGQNQMFCEDAARRVQAALKDESQILAFSGEFRHLESLHPHDAVARISQGDI